MNILKDIVALGLYSFHREFTDWKEAIKANAQPLLVKGFIEDSYTEAVISCIEEYGPYIVMLPNVAIPHSTEQATGVSKTSVSLMHVAKPVVFDENDPEKDAILFFMIASCSSEEHLKVIQNLCEVLDNDDLVQALINCNNEQELLALVASL